MKPARVEKAKPGGSVTFAGLALIAAAFAWWVSYYSQLGGLGFRFDGKLDCVAGDSDGCTLLQQFIGASVLPAYSPLMLWGGVVVTILGLFLTRWNRA